MPGSARYGAFMSGHPLGKPPWAEPAFLRNVQYADDRNLAGRVVSDLIKLDGAEPMLRRAFGTVTRHDLTGKLLLSGPRPVTFSASVLASRQRTRTGSQRR
jgi:hypothetical protein